MPSYWIRAKANLILFPALKTLVQIQPDSEVLEVGLHCMSWEGYIQPTVVNTNILDDNSSFSTIFVHPTHR